MDSCINAGIPAITAALAAAGTTHELEIYADAPHAFLNHTNGSRYVQPAAVDAWADALRWLQAPRTPPAGQFVAPLPARITDVFVTGTPGAYTFAVTVGSPDTGCDSYVDWWEVVTLDGELIHRHTLFHSHVDEQPFTRAGGPIAIAADDEMVVRADMNSTGGAPTTLRLRAVGRQTPVELAPDFGAALESQQPQAPTCAF